MEHSNLTQFRGSEATLPAPLFSFLQQLGEAQNSGEVWSNFKSLSKAFGLPSVTYIHSGCPLDPSIDEENRWHILSTSEDPRTRKLPSMPLLDAFFAAPPTRAVSLTPKLVQMREPQMSDEEYARQSDLLVKLGMPVGLTIPLMSGDAQENAVILVGTPRSEAECNSILERFGCGLHLAAMASHARYCSLYKQEFAERAQLTEKQTELIALVGAGLLDKQIAHQLGISFSAVRQRLAAVQHKTGARNRAHLSAMAMRIGLSPDPLMANAHIAAE